MDKLVAPQIDYLGQGITIEIYTIFSQLSFIHSFLLLKPQLKFFSISIRDIAEILKK